MSHTAIQIALDQINHIILGKKTTVKLALTCMLVKGHLLIEDVPGVGKTTLAHTIAKTVGLSFQRVQFTSDMLPADIIGTSVFDRKSSEFHFHRGPLFNQCVLADEVNRATPRTQSALLEAMEEQQVSIDGDTYALPSPFFVIATQNPSHQIGTYPLPESQLDRFMMRLSLGYLDSNSEKALLLGQDRRQMLADIKPVLNEQVLLTIQNDIETVHVSEAIADYVQSILQFTRDSGLFTHGLSARSGLALVKAAKAWAYIEQREMLLPEDIQAVLASVITHRLNLKDASHHIDVASTVIKSVPIV
jgi:MoxR-like ATPase